MEALCECGLSRITSKLGLALTSIKPTKMKGGNDGESYGQESLEGASLMSKKNLKMMLVEATAKKEEMGKTCFDDSKLRLVKREIFSSISSAHSKSGRNGQTVAEQRTVAKNRNSPKQTYIEDEPLSNHG
ncbi:hypothetical protein PIB30_044463 [Stylosanthes scabra]|uniref:Uncharacterized protein n=1 Tax=Stylosanthes scabra TaxID=79078 RepID=A0ABU6TFJ1_9FABA|nr:hypothetical protein [Stylosanthes scabra]